MATKKRVMSKEHKQNLIAGRKKAIKKRQEEKQQQIEIDKKIINKPFISKYSTHEIPPPPKNRFKKHTRHKVKRRRELYEYGTAGASIRNHCIECCGYATKETDNCTCNKCWLYPWRFGMTPERAHKLGKEVG